MADPITYREAINHVKRGFHIFGLTGYTGSGCSEVRKMLTSSESPGLPGYESLKQSEIGQTELSKRGNRIYDKLKRIWNNKANDWVPFISIEISPIIFGFAITQAIQESTINENFNSIADQILSDKDNILPLTRLWIGSPLPKNDENKSDHFEIINAYEKIKQYYEQWRSSGVKHLIIKAMQDYGDIIRKYGKAFKSESEVLNPKNLFVIPEAIRRLINAYRTTQDSKYFVIDAFRNPFEIEYFKWRYAEFYLVGILCNEKERKDRLVLLPDDFKKISKKEKGQINERTSTNLPEWICSQDINECLRKADIYIDNSEHERVSLKYNLIKLLVLSEEPGCIPPTQNERNMQIAATARMMSGCISRQVGAVVTNKEGYVIGIGWNDPPRNQTPCSLRTGKELINNPTDEVFSEYERKDEFKDFVKENYMTDKPFCFRELHAEMQNKVSSGNSNDKKLEYARALHAEENALLQAIRNNPQGLDGSILYTTASPCNLCAKKAYHLGIDKIIYIEEYPGIHIDQTVKAGTRKINIKGFEGVNASAYFRLFASSIPEKDLIQLFK